MNAEGNQQGLRDYVTVTAAYWAFTLTDGALRMLVLLYLHQLGRTPLEIASLFLFYEFFGVVTNLAGGWIGARFGLRLTLLCGLATQVIALSLLGIYGGSLTLAIVMGAQALSGIAKDLTKMSAKSYIKFVLPEGDSSRLMRWVSILTGSKNALKGIGFFLGGLLLATIGFRSACFGMATGLTFTLLASFSRLPNRAGKATSKTSIRALLSQNTGINWLSAARLFLFAARDIWFVLALPIFMVADLNWTHAEVGSALALWIIGYGAIQSLAPAFLSRMHIGHGQTVPDAHQLGRWTLALLLPLLGTALALHLDLPRVMTLLTGLAAFGVVFAGNSAIHSFLIVHYGERDSIATSVGFYYMANASGRLIGTVLSGMLFQLAGQGQQGLMLCFTVAAAFVLSSALLSVPLARWELRHPLFPPVVSS